MQVGSSHSKAPSNLRRRRQKSEVDANVLAYRLIRIGLALGTAGLGKQILGGVDHSLFEGELTTITTSLNPAGWPVNFVVNGTKSLVFNSIVHQFDSGTANVFTSLLATSIY